VAAPTSHADRLASIGIVLLGLVVAVVAVVAIKDERKPEALSPAALRSSTSAAPHTTTSTTPRQPTTAPSTRTVTTPSIDVHTIPLVVMNNTATTGLAAGARQRFEAAGWTVTSIGTMSNDIISTCAYYDPAQRGAKSAARALQRDFPTIKRVLPRFAELPEGPVVVVLTWDYSTA
jgi:hypothetical protein